MGTHRTIAVTAWSVLFASFPASSASAQDAGVDAPDAVEVEADGADRADAPDDGDTGREHATIDEAGDEVGATGSVVPDDREAELMREQAAMEAEEARGEGGVAAAEEEDDAESLDHEYQVGIRIGAGVPFLFALRYSDGPICEQPAPMMDPRTFCVFVGSGILDGELSFGATPDLEITAMARVGMVPVEPTRDRQILVGLGFRSYLSPESLFKFFLGVKAILDLTPANGVADWGPVDFGVRGEAGVQLDIVRYVGLYAQLAVNVTFLRAFAIAPDVTGGVQIRFP